jgi:ligand-binding sensor domain-containing protein/signal transduction histidine kinase
MKALRLFIAALLFLGRPGFAGAQTHVKFTHLTNLDGLSQSTVQAIVKDRQGFMWFGTQDGLNRYDGYNFKVYRHIPGDTNSLRRSHIMSVYEDRQGRLWVGTSKGALSLYEPKHDHFIHYKEMYGDHAGLSNSFVTSMYEDRQGNFWVGTYWKLNLLDRKTGDVAIYGHDPADANSISNDNITCLYEDSHNRLWVGTVYGLNLLDRRTKKFKRFFHTDDASSLSDNNITAIHEDAQGRLWIGTAGGLNLMDPVSGACKRFVQDGGNSASLGNNSISAIEDAEGGRLWVGTNVYLDLFDPQAGRFLHFNYNSNDPASLNKSGNVTALYKSGDGILWVGTYQGGINKYDERLTFFDLYRNNPGDWQSLSFNTVTSFAEGPDGNIWVGTGGGGLNLWNRATNTFTRFNPDPLQTSSLASWGVLCLSQSKKSGCLWIGTYGACIDRYDPRTNRFRHYSKGDRPDQLNNDAVYAVLEDSRGMVWMGTNGGGVNVLDPRTGIIRKFMTDPNDLNSLPSNYVRSFCEDIKGHIWIGTVGGVSKYDPANGSFTNYSQSNSSLLSDAIFSLYEDRHGNIWIGTLGGGLSRLDPQTGTITSFTTSDGLADNTINGITEDNQGYLWVSTNSGISRFSPETRTFKNMGLDNGIQSFEFSQGAVLKTGANEILFGGVNGYNVIYPDRLRKNEAAPPVAITGFKIFNKPVVADGESPLQQSIMETREITLSYRQSIFSFEFAALNYTAPDKNHYAYMLEGFDKEWIYPGTGRTATYTNLDPGEYVFRVKAANNDGVWNEKGATIRITITPPFWKTWWFRVMALLLAAGAVFLGYAIRMRSLTRQQVLLQQQVRERTQSLAQKTQEERKARQLASETNRELERKNKELEQFAYVASHDMQEPLRTISSFVDLLKLHYQNSFDERGQKYMTYIVQATDRMKVLINDLLEYSRIGRKKEAATVDCQQLVGEVVEDLRAALSEAGARIEIGSLPVIRAYPTELKQIFQNLVTNAVKFRKKEMAPLIKIAAEKKEGYWQFSVTDNGIGIDPAQTGRIFVIFQRLHTRSEYEGSGIGLSNCKKIAELHKGRIWVESTPGAGSTFFFTVGEYDETESDTAEPVKALEA